MTSGRTYSLEARDQTGVMLGLSTRELAMMGGGLVMSVVFRMAGVAGVLAFVPFVLAVALAKVKVGSRTLLEWVPLLTSWSAAGATRRRRWTAPLPLLPAGESAFPPALRGVTIREVSLGGGRAIAVVADRRGTRLTAVFEVRGSQFAAADAASQDVLIEGWGSVLSSFAESASPVVQVGWSEMTGPDDLVAHRDWCDQRLTAVGVGAGDPEGYLELVGEIQAAAVAHRTYVWITVDGHKAHDHRGRPAARAAAHLPVAVDNLQTALFDAGLQTAGPMTAADLRHLLRTRIDPCHPPGPGRTSRGTLAERLGLVEAHEAGPMAVSTAWSQLRMDASFHRVLWVATWPRRPVEADWLTGFLAAGVSRTMTVLHRPLDPQTSQRRVESQLAKLAAHKARKEQKDRRVTEADVRTEEAVHQLEEEVASGFAEVLYLGLVAVSAPSLDDLDDACRHTVQSARAAGLVLRVLHGRQDLAWAASLPFGMVEPGALEVMGL